MKIVHFLHITKFLLFYSMGPWPNPQALDYVALEKSARNKHSSSLGPFIKYEENKVLRIFLCTTG